MTQHWTSQYLGIPWITGGRDPTEGLDCWGLLRHVYDHSFGVKLNTHQDVVIEQPETALRLSANELQSDLWTQVQEPREGDSVAIGRSKGVHHVGIYIEPGSVLHTQKGSLSHIQRIKDMRFKGVDTIIFYRHAHRA